MTCFLVLSTRFLDDRYHGLTAHGERAEWPPSPFRLFQALVAGNARGAVLPKSIGDALRWLESLDPPVIIAPHASEGLERLTYVINNYSHKDAKSRAPKAIRPMILNGDRLVEYAWTFDESLAGAMTHANAVIAGVRRIRCLGWGIDMAIGIGATVDAMPSAAENRRVFRPDKSGSANGIDLRSPTFGSLKSLEDNYVDFLKRYQTPGVTRMEAGEALHAPVLYVPHSSRHCAAFRFFDPETDERRSYPATRAVSVAGMIRGAVHKVAKNARRDPKWIEEFVCGHHQGPDSFPRFSYLPLPSIQPVVGVGRISRVLIAEQIGSNGSEIAWLKRMLPDQTAVNEQGQHADLEEIRGHDKVLSCYVGESHVWTTVAPVALPGSDDGLTSKTAKLFDKMLRHAGYSPDAVQDIEYHRGPFLRGAEDAKRYRPRGNHYLSNCTMYHMCIRWKFPMRGPIALGAGRHCGLGVFASATLP